MPSPDERASRVAGRHLGLITHQQALACGFTQRMIGRRVASGRWRRLHLGVYVIAGVPIGFEVQSLAAALAVRGAVSHRAAGALWGFEGLSPDRVEVLTIHDRYPLLGSVTVHRSRTLVKGDLTRRGPIPITSPVRTVIDLAGVLRPDPLEDALDSGLQRLVDLRQLRRRLDADLRGQPGIAILRSLVDARLGRGPSGSGRENRVRRALVRAGLPEPVRQYVIRDPLGRFVARPDLAYPEARVYIEYDGAGHATRAQLERDNDRQNRLIVLGWLPLRFTNGSFQDVDRSIVERVQRVLGSVSDRMGT